MQRRRPLLVAIVAPCCLSLNLLRVALDRDAARLGSLGLRQIQRQNTLIIIGLDSVSVDRDGELQAALEAVGALLLQAVLRPLRQVRC